MSFVSMFLATIFSILFLISVACSVAAYARFASRAKRSLVD
jgi:hypothetical protein